MGFENILFNTLQNEGGYKSDSLETANYGIKQDTYNKLAPSMGLQPKSVKDIKYGEVKKIYEEEYFKKPRINELPSEKIQGLVFDYAVNAGSGTAIKNLQEIVGAKPDGVIGKKTIKAINDYLEKYGEDILGNELLNARASQYINLSTSAPGKYAKYEKGWINRINNLRTQYKLP